MGCKAMKDAGSPREAGTMLVAATNITPREAGAVAQDRFLFVIP
jgi:hypothetical protein